MRLFTGIDIPNDVAAHVSGLLDRLRPTAHLKWTAPYNLHLTTKFIGEWKEARVPELVEKLQPLGKRAAFPIHLEGIGWYPNPHNPRILWTGVKAGPELAKLASDTDESLSELGIAKDTKQYSPHLTLARVKEPVSLTHLRQQIAQLPSVDFGSFAADRFYLYLSQPGPSGSIYTKLAEIPLTAE